MKEGAYGGTRQFSGPAGAPAASGASAEARPAAAQARSEPAAPPGAAPAERGDSLPRAGAPAGEAPPPPSPEPGGGPAPPGAPAPPAGAGGGGEGAGQRAHRPALLPPGAAADGHRPGDAAVRQLPLRLLQHEKQRPHLLVCPPGRLRCHGNRRYAVHRQDQLPAVPGRREIPAVPVDFPPRFRGDSRQSLRRHRKGR